jgi:hypothetical protein
MDTHDSPCLRLPTKQLILQAAKNLLAHRDAGRKCDPSGIEWAEWIVKHNGPQPNDLSTRPERHSMTTDTHIEQEIQAKGLTAPRVTLADVEANIIDEAYFTAEQGYQAEMKARYPDLAAMGNQFPNSALGLLTFCVLTMRNGFTVAGESACASPENFDAELGRKIARANAVNKVWPLMGYELKSRLHG